MSLALDAVCAAYESDRQPETLAEASGYLKRLTAGRYQRIWTPFGESALCVDDQQGQSRRVEALSRGTREQVYLSLRLALASAYGRRGAGLPLILDDVFVNFDAQRARAAAQTVCDFAAAGNQVLVFTCHDHIRDVFQSLGVDIRCLPAPEDVAESGRPVLPEPAARHPLPQEQPVVLPPRAGTRPVPEPPRVFPDAAQRQRSGTRFRVALRCAGIRSRIRTVPGHPRRRGRVRDGWSRRGVSGGLSGGLRESGALAEWDRSVREVDRPPVDVPRESYADYDHRPPIGFEEWRGTWRRSAEV